MLITRTGVATAVLLGVAIAAAAVGKPPGAPARVQVSETPALEAFRVLAAEEGRYRDRLARLERLREVAADDAELLGEVDAVHRRAIRVRSGRIGALREKFGDDAFFAAVSRHQEARLRNAMRRDDGETGRTEGGEKGRTRLGPRAYPDSKWILLCHCPPGNPENHGSIRVSQKAFAFHLAHGDQLGPCAGDGVDDAEFVDDPDVPARERTRKGRP